MAKITLQPNAEQLEALLKSDGEQAWLDLRESIVQQFAARHLKAVVATPVMEEAIKAITEVARQEVQESIGRVNFNQRLDLTPKFQTAVKDFISQSSKRVADSIFQSIEQQLDTEIQRVAAAVIASIDTKLNYAVDIRIKQELKTRLDAALKAIS